MNHCQSYSCCVPNLVRSNPIVIPIKTMPCAAPSRLYPQGIPTMFQWNPKISHCIAWPPRKSPMKSNCLMVIYYGYTINHCFTMISPWNAWEIPLFFALVWSLNPATPSGDAEWGPWETPWKTPWKTPLETPLTRWKLKARRWRHNIYTVWCSVTGMMLSL